MGQDPAVVMAQYGQVTYWDERYTNDKEVFDWYQRYDGIKSLITRFVEPESRVLMVGCGNSRLSEEMYEDNIKDITNIDISDTCIVDMKKRCVAMEDMGWGTMDSILCGEGSTKNVAVMCKHISRVLKPGGAYIVVSYGQPDYRMNYFDKPEYNWTVLPVQNVNKPCVSAVADPDPANVHYVYVMQKNK